jgi:hypothetical protein
MLDIFFLGELHIAYMDQRARFSSCSECYMDRLRFVGFHSPFLNQFWIASRLVFSLCEAMVDRLCGLVVRVLGYRSGGPGSIPDTTRKKTGSGSGTGSTQPCEYN